MAEEATRSYPHREPYWAWVDSAESIYMVVKALIALAFETVRQRLGAIGNRANYARDIAQPMMRRPGKDNGRAESPNRFGILASPDRRTAIVGALRSRAAKVSDAGIANGFAIARGVIRFAVAGLRFCRRLGQVIFWAAYHRARQFHHDGKVELTKVETVGALLLLASIGFLSAWLASGSVSNDQPLAVAPATAGVGERFDPKTTGAAAIATRGLAHLIVERPRLEGRLSWPEEPGPMPLPIPARLAETEAAPEKVTRSASATSDPALQSKHSGASANETERGSAVPLRVREATKKLNPATASAVAVDGTRPADRVTSTPPPAPSIARPEIVEKAPVARPARIGDKAKNVPHELTAASLTPSGAPAGAGAGTDGAYQVQLVALAAREDAWKMWQRLLDKHEDVLGDLEPDISSRRTRKRNLVYRLRAGPIDSRSEADALCATLSKRKVDCLVVRASG